MADANLGGNEFTFAGDRTEITFYPVAPGPIRPGEEGASLRYAGVEGDFTFHGHDVGQAQSSLGTLLSVVLKRQDDTGGITLTVLLPHVTGVTGQNPVTFETLAIKASSRGFTARPGADLTYTIVPLLGTAQEVILPLVQQAQAQEQGPPTPAC